MGETEDYFVNVEVSTGLASTEAPSFHVLPTADGVQLLSDTAYIGATYTLFDATGRALITGRITSDRTDVPVRAFATGAYTVLLSNGEVRVAKRFVR